MGQLFHAPGPSAGGWLVVAVHESQKGRETFHDTILMPKMQAGIPGGFTSAPEERAFEVHNMQK